MGGHARVVAELLSASGHSVRGFVAPVASPESGEYLGDDEAALGSLPVETPLANGLGFGRGPEIRRETAGRYAKFSFPFQVHPRAMVSPSAKVGEGTMIFAGAAVQTRVRLGVHVVINTRASVDHDSTVGSWAHIGPGATLCGEVEIGEGAQIGAGATIIAGVKVGAHAIVGAGAVVIRDVAPRQRVAGVPAKPL